MTNTGILYSYPVKAVGKANKFRLWFTAALFFFFLFPLSLSVGNEGLSVNYAFILFPLVTILIKGYLKRPSGYLSFFLLLYTAIFVVALVYQVDFLSFFPRRIVSFILFIAVFLYVFIDIDKTMIDSFKIAVVAIGIYFSFSTLFKYFTMGGAELGFAAKGEIGSQRFGFVYVTGIWLCWFYQTSSLLQRLIKYAVLGIITVGLLLTFSRSGLVALGVSGAFFMVKSFISWFRYPTPGGLMKFVLFILFAVGLFFLLGAIFPALFEFFDVRLFSFLSGKGEETLDLVDADSSEGFRIFLIQKAMQFIAYNPFTGGGFLGIWVLFESLSGSAHDQYLDIVFRTGIPGFIAYLYLLYRILVYLYKNDQSLFWGMLAIVVYGFFHETFKLSQGAFMLSFLLGMTESKRRLTTLQQVSYVNERNQ